MIQCPSGFRSCSICDLIYGEYGSDFSVLGKVDGQRIAVHALQQTLSAGRRCHYEVANIWSSRRHSPFLDSAEVRSLPLPGTNFRVRRGLESSGNVPESLADETEKPVKLYRNMSISRQRVKQLSKGCVIAQLSGRKAAPQLRFQQTLCRYEKYCAE